MPVPVKALSWRQAAVLLVMAAALLVVAGIAATGGLEPEPMANRTAGPASHGSLALPTGHAAAVRGPDPVGALFVLQHGHLGAHFCTASVVASPAGNLLITAAHCVTGVSLAAPGGLAFAPGYADGSYPHGLWQVTMTLVDRRWAAKQDPNNDVAFLVVKPLAGTHAPASSVQRAAGAERIRFDAPLPEPIRAIGYPDMSDAPVGCSSQAVAFRPVSLDQVKFVCPGFTDGTSGGPMLTGFQAGTGAVIGVIGGYQQGGNTASVSYSSAFSASIRALYQQAVQAGQRQV